jgi:HlyD family secretion protein
VNWKRTAVFTLLGLALAAAIFLGMQPQPMEVDHASVAEAPLRVTVDEEGKTRLRNVYVVSAPLAGTLRRLPFKVGDPIAAGQPVATLEPVKSAVLDPRSSAEAAARMQAASALREAADARLATAVQNEKAAAADAEFWQSQLAREEKLLKSGDIPAERVERTRAEARRTAALLDAAKQSVSLARAEIQRSRADVESAQAAASNPSLSPVNRSAGPVIQVRSPVSGRVLKLVQESESVVQPGQPILEIGNTRALEIVVELLSTDAVKVAPATPVELSRWGGDKPLQALVRLIEPAGFTKLSALGVEEQRVRVVADLTSPESDYARLGDGYRVEAAFILWQSDKVLQVPASALFRKGEQWQVFVIQNSVAQLRDVTVGHRNGLAAEITAGLKPGEMVIVHPNEKLAAGAQVKLRPAPTA